MVALRFIICIIYNYNLPSNNIIPFIVLQKNLTIVYLQIHFFYFCIIVVIHYTFTYIINPIRYYYISLIQSIIFRYLEQLKIRKTYFTFTFIFTISSTLFLCEDSSFLLILLLSAWRLPLTFLVVQVCWQ